MARMMNNDIDNYNRALKKKRMTNMDDGQEKYSCLDQKVVLSVDIYHVEGLDGPNYSTICCTNRVYQLVLWVEPGKEYESKFVYGSPNPKWNRQVNFQLSASLLEWGSLHVEILKKDDSEPGTSNGISGVSRTRIPLPKINQKKEGNECDIVDQSKIAMYEAVVDNALSLAAIRMKSAEEEEEHDSYRQALKRKSAEEEEEEEYDSYRHVVLKGERVLKHCVEKHGYTILSSPISLCLTMARRMNNDIDNYNRALKKKRMTNKDDEQEKYSYLNQKVILSVDIYHAEGLDGPNYSTICCTNRVYQLVLRVEPSKEYELKFVYGCQTLNGIYK
ncbi:hypothetical protein C1H46_029753 [Malus baccata]|uniref:C2 domain-containing protein n=1 Tax=Malus baccata TaxID=106549 RepID=A0A540LDW0_MALBA|nr:hypothetical protein C1H46_029753 [Malus baccata]